MRDKTRGKEVKTGRKEEKDSRGQITGETRI